MKIKVKVPATSANLGIGYDCLGIALDAYCIATFEEIEHGLEISGCEQAYCNSDNLFYRSFCAALEYMQKKVQGVRIHIDSNIPTARGLGSSATCIVAGITAASAMFQNAMNKYEIFDLAAKLEGHPDNVAPAIFGALCVSFMEEGHASMIRYGIKKDMHFIAIIPNYEVKTEDARKVLPTQMSYHDAVYQMGRCAAFAKALEIGNMLIVKKACKDKMQEPYRKQLIPEYDKIRALCERFGADTMFLSGSGSTMMALTREEECAMQLKKQLQIQYPAWDLRILHATYDGVQSEVL